MGLECFVVFSSRLFMSRRMFENHGDSHLIVLRQSRDCFSMYIVYCMYHNQLFTKQNILFSRSYFSMASRSANLKRMRFMDFKTLKLCD